MAKQYAVWFLAQLWVPSEFMGLPGPATGFLNAFTAIPKPTTVFTGGSLSASRAGALPEADQPLNVPGLPGNSPGNPGNHQNL
jgi:hypothetical protein